MLSILTKKVQTHDRSFAASHGRGKKPSRHNGTRETKGYNTRQKSWNTCVCFPFPNVALGITVVSVLQNTRGSTLGREKAHFRGKPVWSINLRIVPETSRKTVFVSTICDEYCSCKGPNEYVNENLFYRFEVSREEKSVGNGFQKTRKWKNRGNIPHLWILINM